MKVILNTDVTTLGEEGDVKDVARGYARNFLIPRDLVLPYTKQNVAIIEGRRVSIERRKDEKRSAAMGLKERIESITVTIKATVGASGRLFGSVSSTMIAEELGKLGIEIERRRIEVPDHTIKSTGSFPVRVKLYGDQEATLKVVVTGDGEKPAEGAASPAAEAPPAAVGAESREEAETETASEEAALDTDNAPEFNELEDNEPETDADRDE